MEHSGLSKYREEKMCVSRKAFQLLILGASVKKQLKYPFGCLTTGERGRERKKERVRERGREREKGDGDGKCDVIGLRSC